MAEQWMSIVEYARTFSISDMTVRRRIKNGKLNAILKEGKYYIQVDDKGVNYPNPSFDDYKVDSLAPGLTHEKGGAVKAKHNSWMDSESVLEKGSSRESSYNSDKKTELESMLDYCERSLTRINSIERHLNDTYKSKLSLLESENKRKDLMIAQLKQQVEDLQILIKMYDKN